MRCEWSLARDTNSLEGKLGLKIAQQSSDEDDEDYEDEEDEDDEEDKEDENDEEDDEDDEDKEDEEDEEDTNSLEEKLGLNISQWSSDALMKMINYYYSLTIHRRIMRNSLKVILISVDL